MQLRVVFGLLALVPAGFAFAAALGAPTAVADEKKAPTFKADVAPLFKNACSGCHSGFKQKARLDVTSYDSVMKKVKAGEPDKSTIHNCLIGKGAKQMPPKNPLSEAQIALVKAWIAGGAKKD
jgi:mono/diheme cytochrome c family protein